MVEESEEEQDEEGSEDEKTKPLFSFRRFIYIFLGVLTIMVLFDPSLRFRIGDILGTVLYPVIGFDSNYPILTLIIAGTMMIAFSTLVRDIFMDWVEMAEMQKKTSAFQKELMEAKRANKTTKVKKLEEMQPEVSQMSMQTFKPQLKSMAITMIVIISIFGWLWTFIDTLPNTTYSVPWAFTADFTQNLGPIPFPQWIGVYMLLSIPLGQVFRLALQMFTYKNKIKKNDDEEVV